MAGLVTDFIGEEKERLSAVLAVLKRTLSKLARKYGLTTGIVSVPWLENFLCFLCDCDLCQDCF